MVLINIQPEEIKAFDTIFKNLKTDIQTGFYLGNFRVKIQQALNQQLEQEKKKKAKEILGIKDEKKKTNKES